jgi:hypothetical protein
MVLVTQAPMAHTCNPSYSGGSDQEANSLRPYLEKTHHKRKKKGVGMVEWLKV